MRISDCAELTGTTVRTIRYYHQIGLLPVPERLAGRRDYGLDHLARILRIRWLADAGLPLDSVATVLAEEREALGAYAPSSLRDLQATATSIDERIAELTDQRHRITALIEMAEQGGELRALPPAWHRFYDHVAAAVTDPETIKVLRREQRLAEMFAQRGLVPVDGEELLGRLTDDDLDFVARFYTRFAHLGQLAPDEAMGAMDELVAEMTDWCHHNVQLTADMVAVLPGWARSPRALATLIKFACLVSSNRRQAEVLRRMVPVILSVSDPEEPAHESH